ncbi:MAG: NAD(+) diphosphatase [Butyrivibrio sp.]|nr:NAD(+) diphosphatase [Butyrivibrio sp.]
MIQDIYPHKFYNQYDPSKKADDESIVLCFKDSEILISGELFPKLKDLKNVNREDLIYLFSVDGENSYFLLNEELEEIPEGYSFVGIKKLRNNGFNKKYRVFACYTAWQLNNWYKNNRFCGRCGKRTSLDTKERAIRCECGNIIYPRIVPAVIVGVINKDKLLVTKYNRGFTQFALVAGFTEIGETLEETVEREVMEEAGLKVKNIRYYKSQPWGIVDDILAGFYCDVDGDDTITMDSEELKVAEWRKAEDIELQTDDFSLTNEMMKRFKDGEKC